MPNKSNHSTLVVTGVMALMALVLGVYLSQQWYSTKSMDVSQFNGTILSKPRSIDPFVLTGIDNKPFDNHQLLGHWTMIFFGFTHCGSICPTTMAELGKMTRLLEKKGAKTLPQVVMISVDPSRDSLDKLAHYVKAFDPHFYGARGEDEEIRRMTQELGVAFSKVEKKSKDGTQQYTVEHTGTIMLFNPRGELMGFFTSPHQASMLAQDYLKLIA